jgi:methylated-DNA-[protein]-cysteine S-methyltransferase
MIFLTVTAVKMQKSLKYTIFRTKWGHFGLAGVENTLLRTCLPLSEPEKVKLELLKSRPVVALKSRIERDKNLFKTLQEQIIAYFGGVCINFSRDIPIALDGFGSFTRSVLTACRNIKFGQTLTYSALAKKLSRPDAARAVGNALAKNPLPLIVPCHRVIRSDGTTGGFSAPGGKNLKAKMLKHENSALIDGNNI